MAQIGSRSGGQPSSRDFILVHEFLLLHKTNSVRRFRENLFAPQKSFREFKQKYLQIERASARQPCLAHFIFRSNSFSLASLDSSLKRAPRESMLPPLSNSWRKQGSPAPAHSICKYFCLKLAERFFRRKKIFAKSPHDFFVLAQKSVN